MEQDQLAQYEQKLLDDKRRLLEEIEEESKPTDYGSDVDSFEEETDEAEDFAGKQGILYALKVRVNEIDNAINAIRSGSYGTCTSCGNEIEKEVLDEVPESRLCRACKTKEAS